MGKKREGKVREIGGKEREEGKGEKEGRGGWERQGKTGKGKG